MDELEQNKNLKLLKNGVRLYSFGENLAGGQTIGASFVTMFFVESGASPIQIGLLHSITLSFQNILQIIWGRVGDKIGKRIPLIVVGGLGYSILWMPILFSIKPSIILILIALQAIFYSMRLPNWIALIGDITPIKNRGKLTADINFNITLSGLLAILFAGIIMFKVEGTLFRIYSIPFTTSMIFGILGTLLFLKVNENGERKEHQNGLNGRNLFNKIKNNKEFTKYLIITFFSNFSLVILLPLISIITIRILKVDKLVYAFYGVVRCISLLIFQKRLGKLTDIIGRKKLMLLQRLIYIIIPGMFFLAPNKYYILIPYAILGFLHAIEGTANLSYLLDLTSSEDRGTLISLFNSIQGIGLFLSSFLSGFFVDKFSMTLGLLEAVKIMIIVTTIARIPTALSYTLLNESKTYEINYSREI